MSDRSTRYVIFDAGDILYDATAWRRWLTQRLVDEGVALTYPQLVVDWEAELVDVYTGKTPYWTAFEGLLAGYGVNQGDCSALTEEARQKGKEFSAGHQPFSGVAAGLKRLKAGGLRLGVLSDTESTAVKVSEKLQRLGLGGLFDAVVTSFDIGAVKPTPQAFEAALRSLDASREHAAFVAHDLDELEGSIQFGLLTVAYNYEAGAPADVYADDFDAVVDALLARD